MPLSALPITFAPFKRRKNFTDLTGKQFREWTVDSFHGRSTKGKYYYWCVCSCGNKDSIRSDYLTDGISTSCGCVKNYPVHGDCSSGRTPEYRTWCSMKSRCLLTSNSRFSDYGGRGIKVCPEWIENYTQFLSDVGRRPTPQHTIHRIDNDGNYEPRNVRWATKVEQQNFRRNSVRLSFNGREQGVSEWSRELGISRHTIHNRLQRGLSIERVLATFQA